MQTTKKYVLLLAGAMGLAVAAFILTKGRLDISMAGKTLSRPTDTPVNLEYGLSYQPSSEHILERDGIILKNYGAKIRAQEITGGICLDASGITDRSSNPILRFSEYVGYFYMYDGETLYRTNVDGSHLKAVIKDCLKYEPMGNYLYSLKQYHGRSRLFRCSINGAYEKMLFKEEVLDFWTYGGHLLMLLADGTYRYYNVLTQNLYIHTLPEGAANITLDSQGILYLLRDGTAGCPQLYRQDYLSDNTLSLTPLPVNLYSPGSGNIALLLSAPDTPGLRAAWCKGDGSKMQIMKEMNFTSCASLDISGQHLFVTEEDGTTWYTPLARENWKPLFEN